MQSIDEYRAALGDKRKATVAEFLKERPEVQGSATFDIALTWMPQSAAIQVPRKALLAAIEAAKPAISRETTRHYLNSVLLELDRNTLFVVATNGHILVKSEVTVSNPAGAKVQCVVSDERGERRTRVPVSSTGLARLVKALRTRKGKTVQLSISSATCVMDGHDFKVIEYPYPDWRRVMPSPDALVGKVTIKPDDLRAFVKASETALRAKDQRWGGCVKFEETTATCSEVELPVNRTKGKFPFGIQLIYLSDLTKKAKGDIVIEPNDHSGPMFIHVGDGTTRVAMPMRV
jgi:DNA polymerase III sliding clamp (beta) subunit (PCNA family)